MTALTSTIAMGPIVEAFLPTISAVVTTMVGIAVTFAVAALKKSTGVTLQSAYVDSLRQAAQTEAGVLIAGAADNLSSCSITVASPVVAAAAARIVATMPDLVKAVGNTPDDIARLIAGEVGKLQARAPTITTPASVSRLI